MSHLLIIKEFHVDYCFTRVSIGWRQKVMGLQSTFIMCFRFLGNNFVIHYPRNTNFWPTHIRLLSLNLSPKPWWVHPSAEASDVTFSVLWISIFLNLNFRCLSRAICCLYCKTCLLATSPKNRHFQNAQFRSKKPNGIRNYFYVFFLKIGSN